MSEHPQYIIEHVIAPFLQSCVSGVLTGSVVTAVAAGIHLSDPLVIGGGTAALVTLVKWEMFRSEAASRRNPPAPPEPVQTYATTIRAEVISTDPSGAFGEGRFLDFITEPEPFRTMCQRLAAGAPLTLAEFGGRGKIYSRAEFENIRSEFIRRGLAFWISSHSPNRGAALTFAGRAFCRYVARSDVLPNPRENTPIGMRKPGPSDVHTSTHKRDWDAWKEARGIKVN